MDGQVILKLIIIVLIIIQMDGQVILKLISIVLIIIQMDGLVTLKLKIIKVKNHLKPKVVVFLHLKMNQLWIKLLNINLRVCQLKLRQCQLKLRLYQLKLKLKWVKVLITQWNLLVIIIHLFKNYRKFQNTYQVCIWNLQKKKWLK